MAAELILRPAVKMEVDEIISYYEKQKKGLGLLFLGVLGEIVDRIQHYPLLFAVQHNKIRKASVKNFPYNVYFRIYKNQIIILAVLHQKRNPKIWKRRK